MFDDRSTGRYTAIGGIFASSVSLVKGESSGIVEVGESTDGNRSSSEGRVGEVLDAVANGDVLDGQVGGRCQESGRA